MTASPSRARRVSACALCLIALAVSACGDDDDAPSAGGSNGDDKVKVGFVVKSLSTEYWVAYASGAKRVAAENPDVDIEITGAASEADARGQIAKVEDLLLKDIDALVITSISDALTPVVRRAAEQGVKVVLGEQPLEGFDDYVTIVGPDQREAAAAGAQFVVDELGSDIEVAFLTAPGISVVEERGDAAQEVFKEAGADIVAEGPAPDCGLPPAINSSEDILQAHPNVDLIYGLCAPPDLGAIKAISQANLVPNEDVHVFGFDGLPEEFKEIQAGRLLGTIDQRPDLQGEAAAEAAIAAARGETVPKTTFSKAIVVNKDNVEDAIAANREATK